MIEDKKFDPQQTLDLAVAMFTDAFWESQQTNSRAVRVYVEIPIHGKKPGRPLVGMVRGS
jgi:hypothetical protein